MGCTGSRLDGYRNNHNHSLSIKHRPRVRRRQDDAKTRRRTRSKKDSRSTPLKKEPVLLANGDDDYRAFPTANPPLRQGTKIEDCKEKKRPRKAKTEYEKDGNDVGSDSDTDEQMIGRLPGSPSFRIYFRDNGGRRQPS